MFLLNLNQDQNVKENAFCFISVLISFGDPGKRYSSRSFFYTFISGTFSTRVIKSQSLKILVSP